ncbi:MAG: family 1 glycosylhydrolase, partial [Deltaproteobacteria bacterium]|nr:family 1 glycosylhydrolase [Deltaproteobacteria bacterium]
VVNSLVGVALNFTPAYPGSGSEADLLAAQRHNGYVSGWFLDPIAGWGYPEHMVRLYGDLMPVFPSTDLDLIAAPIDVLGVNYYQRVLVVHEEQNGGILQLAHLERPGAFTANREIFPKGLGDVLRDLHFHYGFQNLLVTDNGAAYQESPDASGFVSDQNRIDFISDHLLEVARARADGIPVNGYFARSLLDGFEFSDGYTIRYGLCHVDLNTMKRTPKASAHFLRSLRMD